MTLQERFYRHVNKDGPNGCWLWMGWVTKHGYGSMCVNKKQMLAHRVSWILHNGPIPSGLGVLHHCDNRRCVNPAHFFLGTNADNTRDMIQKGRARKASGLSHGRYTKPESNPVGVRNGRARLTEDGARAIVTAYRNGEGAASISRRTGMSEGAVRHILKKGRNWKHLFTSHVVEQVSSP